MSIDPCEDGDDDMTPRRLPLRPVAARHLTTDGPFHWMDQAACSPSTAELFHIDRHRKGARQRAEAALQICARCPVAAHCARFCDASDIRPFVSAGRVPEDLRGRNHTPRVGAGRVLDFVSHSTE